MTKFDILFSSQLYFYMNFSIIIFSIEMSEMSHKLSRKEFLKLADLLQQPGPQVKYQTPNAWRNC